MPGPRVAISLTQIRNNATAIAANLRALCKARHAALLQANINTATTISPTEGT